MPDPAVSARRAFTVVAIAAVVAVLVGFLLGALVGSPLVGLVAGVVLGLAGALVAWRWSAPIVLRFSRARPADPASYPRLFNLVEGLGTSLGVDPPSLYVVDDTAANAFALGRDPHHAALGFTEGLLDTLSRVELEAVVAHLLVRVKSGAIGPETVAAVVCGWPSLLGDSLLRKRWPNGGRETRAGDPPEQPTWVAALGRPLLAWAPVGATLIRWASGGEEADDADLAAVSVTRYPPGLAGALTKLERVGTVTHAAGRATAALWLAPPLPGATGDGRFARWNRAALAAHPALADRIVTLKEL